MSNNHDSNNPLEELQKQFAELFGKGSKVTLPFQLDEGPKKTDPEAEYEQKTKDEETLRRIQAFNLKPKEIRDYLDRFVIKQNNPKKVLSVAICDHYNHVRACLKDPSLLSKDYSKQNILLLGSTGVGKTYLMRTIAKLIGVPFVKADATKFSETGYVGGEVEDVVRDLVKAANGNIELAQYGIIYIDEIDKIASEGSSNGRDISGRGVQINLLKLMEDTAVNVFSSNDIMGQMRSVFNMGGNPKKQKPTINTRHILFIVSGAFDKLAGNVKRRLNHNAIGFTSASSLEDHSSNYLQKANTADFITYGFEPEFIGRLPIRVACEPLKEDDLAQILLSSEGSILKQYKEDFRGYGIDCTVELDAIQEIAKRAAVEQTGARGLMTILEHTFRPFKFELPSSPIKDFTVTAQTVTNPDHALKSLLSTIHSEPVLGLEEDLQRFVEAFEIENGLKLNFEKQAVTRLLTLAERQKKGVRLLCEDLFKNFAHGLKLIARNSQQKVFTISAEVIENPEKELSQWIIHSFNESLSHAPSESRS